MQHRQALMTAVSDGNLWELWYTEYAFEELKCHAVEFRTHRFNTQSRRAIERLGAQLDGILRNHMVMPNGTLRDTCVYSILEREWPMVKAHLGYTQSTLGVYDMT